MQNEGNRICHIPETAPCNQIAMPYSALGKFELLTNRQQNDEHKRQSLFISSKTQF